MIFEVIVVLICVLWSRERQSVNLKFVNAGNRMYPGEFILTPIDSAFIFYLLAASH